MPDPPDCPAFIPIRQCNTTPDLDTKDGGLAHHAVQEWVGVGIGGGGGEGLGGGTVIVTMMV